MKFVISPTARVSLNEILDFLKKRWTAREIITLKNDIKNFKQTIRDGIVKHQSLENFPHIKFTLIGKKQVKLFYEIKENVIVIKLFWHCKQDTRKLHELLNQKSK